MGGLQSGDDTLGLSESTEAGEGFGVGGGNELGAVAVLPVGELGADTGVVETGGDGVGFGDLAVLVLEDVGADTVEDTLAAAGEGGGVAVGVDTVTTGFNTQELDAGVVREGVEHTHGVTATTNAGDDSIGQLADKGLHLFLGFITNDRLEGTHDGREGVRPDGGTDDVVGSVEVDNPGAEGLVDSITEGAAAGVDGNDGSTKKSHTEDIESLTTDILGTHVHDTLHAELGANGSRGDTVLASTSLGNDSLLAQTAGKQDLTESVVDLVTSSVVKILTLQPDVGTADMLRQAVSKMKAAGAAHVGVVGAVFLPELRVVARLIKATLELGQAVHQGFGHVLATELAETGGNESRVTRAVQSFNLVDQARASRGVVVGNDISGLREGRRSLLQDGVKHVDGASHLALSVSLKATTGHAGKVVLGMLSRLAGRGVTQNGDDLATNNNTLGDVLDGQEVLAGANTES